MIMTLPSGTKDPSRRSGQFSLFRLFLVMTICAGAIGACCYVWDELPLSPHERAVSSVNARDGWAHEDDSGFIIANLNGGTIQINDKSLEDLIACKRLRKLTADHTAITDQGLAYLTRHKDLTILHLDFSLGVT